MHEDDAQNETTETVNVRSSGAMTTAQDGGVWPPALIASDNLDARAVGSLPPCGGGLGRGV